MGNLSDSIIPFDKHKADIENRFGLKHDELVHMLLLASKGGGDFYGENVELTDRLMSKGYIEPCDSGLRMVIHLDKARIPYVGTWLHEWRLTTAGEELIDRYVNQDYLRRNTWVCHTHDYWDDDEDENKEVEKVELPQQMRLFN
jgi:hypothetical protein